MPMNNTTQDVLTQLLSAILGGSQGMGAAAPLVNMLLTKVLGISKDSLLNSIITSAASPSGSYFYSNQALFRSVAAGAGDRMLQESKLEGLSGFARTFYSEAEYERLKATGEIHYRTYDDYITAKAMGLNSNFITSKMYDLLDPMGANKAAEYLTSVAGNLMRYGVLNGNRDSAAIAKEIASKLFINSAGEFDYSASTYSGFSLASTSAIAAAISKNMDLDLNITDANAIYTTIDRFKRTLSEYTKALRPLKDVFGENLDEMLTTLESISGQSLGTMNPAKVRFLADKISAGMMIGGYDINTLLQVTTGVRNQLYQIGVPDLAVMSSYNVALNALNAANQGYTPIWLTQEKFSEEAARFMIGTGTSRGADMIAKGYSLWAYNRNKIGASTDFSIYQQQLTQERMQGVSAEQAILNVAGVRSGAALARGLNYDYYKYALDSGNAQFAGTSFAIWGELEYMKDSLLKDTTLAYDVSNVGKSFDSLIQIISDNPAFFSLDFEGKKRFLMDTLNLNERTATDIATLATRISSDPRYSDTMTNYIAVVNSSKARELERVAAERSKNADYINEYYSSDLKTLFKDAFIKGGDLFSVQGFKNLLSKKFRDALDIDPEFRSEMEAITGATTTLAFATGKLRTKEQYKELVRKAYNENSAEYVEWLKNNPNGTFEQFVDEKALALAEKDFNAVNEDIQSNINYTNSANGLGNLGYRAALEGYRRAYEEGDAEAMKLYAIDMELTKNIGTDTFRRYLTNDQTTAINRWKDLRNKVLSGASMDTIKYDIQQTLFADAFKDADNEYIRDHYTGFNAWKKEAQDKLDLLNSIEDKNSDLYKDLYKEYDTYYKSTGDFKEDWDLYKKYYTEKVLDNKELTQEAQDALNIMTDKVNTNANGADAPAGPSDILDILKTGVPDLFKNVSSILKFLEDHFGSPKTDTEGDIPKDDAQSTPKVPDNPV